MHTVLCRRCWEFNAKPAYICNILNDDLYIDALITELFQIFLVVSQTLGEGTQGTGVHFPDLNPNSYDNLNTRKLDLNVSAKVKLNANDQVL